MDKPLTDVEKKTLTDAGWAFMDENYIYVPDDYDGCMAHGIKQIRRVLARIQNGQPHSAMSVKK